MYISSVACVYEFLAWAQLAPIYVTATGRPNSIFRYIMWGHATPAMLYAMGMMSDLSRRRVSYIIALDIVMIVTALPGELVPGAADGICWGPACSVQGVGAPSRRWGAQQAPSRSLRRKER